MASLKGNKKVAKARGESWKKKLIKGKLDAKLKPSLLYLQRIKKGLSQNDLAKELNISLATYGAIERGKRSIKVQIAKNLSDRFNTKYNNLFNLTKAGKLFAIKNN